MRRIIVAGNWKMNKTTKEAAQFFAEFKPLVADVKNAETISFGNAAASKEAQTIHLFLRYIIIVLHRLCVRWQNF